MNNLEKEAALWQGAMYDESHAAGKPAPAYNWHYIEAYPIDRITDKPTDWVEWLKEEQAMWAADGDPERYDGLLNEPIREAVCLIDIEGFGGYLWDGYHRTAATVTKGGKTIRAIVGIPKIS